MRNRWETSICDKLFKKVWKYLVRRIEIVMGKKCIGQLFYPWKQFIKISLKNSRTCEKEERGLIKTVNNPNSKW